MNDRSCLHTHILTQHIKSFETLKYAVIMNKFLTYKKFELHKTFQNKAISSGGSVFVLQMEFILFAEFCTLLFFAYHLVLTVVSIFGFTDCNIFSGYMFYNVFFKSHFQQFLLFALLIFFFFLVPLPCYMVFRILVPHPGIKPVLPASEAQSLNHWTIREAPL